MNEAIDEERLLKEHTDECNGCALCEADENFADHLEGIKNE